MTDPVKNSELPQPRNVTSARARPNLGWTCGMADLGCPCQAGPTPDGRCSRSVANKFQSRDEATGRIGTDHGPRDDDQAGDLEIDACIPKPNSWLRRRALRTHLALLTGSLLLLFMLLPSREHAFVPGELSSQHAQILENTMIAQRCSLCHPASHSAVDAANPGKLVLAVTRQDDLCMKCHEAHLPGAVSRNAHDISPEMLELWQTFRDRSNVRFVSTLKTSAIPPMAAVSKTDSATDSRATQVSCSACHVEHHGRGFDLKAISDKRCQACHREKFESFSSGHPEFEHYPIPQPRSISFTHAAHQGKHFAQKNKEFDCRDCHVTESSPTSVGPVARTLSFEQTCAECHDKSIRNATLDGWALIQLPSLTADLVAAEPALNHWTKDAQFGIDGVFPVTLRALLAADDSAAEALSLLPSSGKLTDIPSVDRERVAVSLAIACQTLINDVAHSGQSAWRARLEKVTQQALGDDQNLQQQRLLDSLCIGVSPDLFRQMQSTWFSGPAQAEESTSSGASGGRGSNDATSVNDANSASKLVVDDLLLSSPSTSEDLLLGATPQPSDEPAREADAKASKGNTKLRGVDHLASGGWYIDHDTLALRLMPRGHADTTLAAWTEWLSLVSPTTIGPLLGRDFIAAEASNSTGGLAAQIPGGCTQCHTLSGQNQTPLSEPNGFASPWRVARRSHLERPFTKFNHTPHLTLPALRDCTYCHGLITPSTESPSVRADDFVHRNDTLQAGEAHLVSQTTPSALKVPVSGSEFASMSTTQCNACHRPGGAEEGCTNCHNYHVRPPTAFGSSALVPTSVTEKMTERITEHMPEPRKAWGVR